MYEELILRFGLNKAWNCIVVVTLDLHSLTLKLSHAIHYSRHNNIDFSCILKHYNESLLLPKRLQLHTALLIDFQKNCMKLGVFGKALFQAIASMYHEKFIVELWKVKLVSIAKALFLNAISYFCIHRFKSSFI